ncbi:RNA polymerase sigma factor [Flavilitoribacter nigricans]|uniref:Sigma-70 family RNA polymerase sigma factor n=1 Tax=Flavilitoribacter nigricans (strain ATCC 23147 / DSM 23189 / NBRC 102662 / NCIMB 1420 / SS-2) TaxID=1122177 RepID=A0A2D0MZ51_FLAN2|nr:sigma-70 family RNA polymerase sigma factor [Flavilitoribacter nigricans]PHN01562.1 hypothetical protein CRP01_36285 [Flavilitoribacter nigricans DSM 23189 = NBRC 102662]
MTDREIPEAIKRGDQRAEQYFYRENKEPCIHYACKRFFWKNKEGISIRCSPEDAEELYNDACALFIQNILKDRIDQLEIKISTYLIKTMQYFWYNKARVASKPRPESPPEEIAETAKESMRINVQRAIAQLDDKCREMMTYRYILGWEDYEDIAQATGKNNGDVVRNLISRCRKRFRELYVAVTNLSDI